LPVVPTARSGPATVAGPGENVALGSPPFMPPAGTRPPAHSVGERSGRRLRRAAAGRKRGVGVVPPRFVFAALPGRGAPPWPPWRSVAAPGRLITAGVRRAFACVRPARARRPAAVRV